MSSTIKSYFQYFPNKSYIRIQIEEPPDDKIKNGLSSQEKRMIAFPNSKINLGLYITEKRVDGYHNLETIFYPLALHDLLEILPVSETTGKEVIISNTGFPVDCQPEKNLCIKAYKLLKADFVLPEIEIMLHKAVPMGAGLGGGSADAAFTLILLNDMYHLNLSQDQLANYAIRLGSDCPFFIFNRPMLGKGRGEILSPVDLNLSGYHFILIKSTVSISTAEAFQGVKLEKPEIPLLEIINLPVSEWKHLLRNNFEDNIFKNHPEIKNIKDTLYQTGALYAAMSGSGSTVFGIFEKPVDASNLFPECFYWSSTPK